MRTVAVCSVLLFAGCVMLPPGQTSLDMFESKMTSSIGALKKDQLYMAVGAPTLKENFAQSEIWSYALGEAWETKQVVEPPFEERKTITKHEERKYTLNVKFSAAGIMEAWNWVARPPTSLDFELYFEPHFNWQNLPTFRSIPAQHAP